MHIVLHQPEIPSNTGNIGRTCVATGSSLHLIEPLGFRINEKELKRAGMDYWDQLDVTRYVNYEEFRAAHPGATVWMATTKARRSYTEVNYGPEDFILFGKESAGIPEELLVADEAHCIRIPMGPQIRSLNLANSVSIVLYEALRQQGFAGLEEKGSLHRLHWQDAAQDRTGSPDEEEEAAAGQAAKGGGMHTAEELTGQVVRAGSARIAPTAVVLGKVTLGERTGIWHNATVRADNETIVIGADSNIQDNCVLHTGRGYPVRLGERVTVGHGAIVHGCTIEDDVIVGMGAILMNGCHVGSRCIIAAGALIPEHREIPDDSVVMGVPGKVIRKATEEDLAKIRANAEHYVNYAAAEL